MVSNARRPYVIAAGVFVAAALTALLVTRGLVPLCFPLDPVADDLPRQAPVATIPAEPPLADEADAGSSPQDASAGSDDEAANPRRRRGAEARQETDDTPPPDRAVYRDDDGVYIVSRQHVERTLERGAAAGSASAHRHVDGDRVVGYRLAGVGGSPLAQLGLRNGDVLTSINGMQIDSADAALGAFGRLRNSDRLNVVVLRGGRRVGLRYRIE